MLPFRSRQPELAPIQPTGQGQSERISVPNANQTKIEHQAQNVAQRNIHQEKRGESVRRQGFHATYAAERITINDLQAVAKLIGQQRYDNHRNQYLYLRSEERRVGKE